LLDVIEYIFSEYNKMLQILSLHIRQQTQTGTITLNVR